MQTFFQPAALAPAPRPSLKQRIRRLSQDAAPKLTLMALGERRWVHEPEVEIVRRLGDRSAAAVDVGANKGVYTYVMSRGFGQVVAFEPQPDLGRYLVKAVPGNVRVVVAALSDSRGTVGFNRPVDAHLNELGSLQALPGIETERFEVETRMLDEFAFADLALLKIDVEGHEMAALGGARGTLARHRPTLIVEAEERHRPNALAELSAVLAPFGYRGHFLEDGRLRPLSAFEAAVHQNVANLAASGARIGRYVSNFVFIADARRTAVLDRIGPVATA